MQYVKQNTVENRKKVFKKDNYYNAKKKHSIDKKYQQNHMQTSVRVNSYVFMCGSVFQTQVIDQ